MFKGPKNRGATIIGGATIRRNRVFVILVAAEHDPYNTSMSTILTLTGCQAVEIVQKVRQDLMYFRSCDPCDGNYTIWQDISR